MTTYLVLICVAFIGTLFLFMIGSSSCPDHHHITYRVFHLRLVCFLKTTLENWKCSLSETKRQFKAVFYVEFTRNKNIKEVLHGDLRSEGSFTIGHILANLQFRRHFHKLEKTKKIFVIRSMGIGIYIFCRPDQAIRAG